MSKEKSVSKLIYSLKTIKNKQEKRDAVLRAYYYAFHQEKISAVAERSFSELSLQEMKDIYSNIVIGNINNIEYSAESCGHRSIIFGFTHLQKFTQSEDEEGVTIVKGENMPRNFTDEELEFFSLSADVIIEFYQICNGNSELTKEQDSNWDLDIVNFSKKVFSSEYLRFDKSINKNEIHKVIYGY